MTRKLFVVEVIETIHATYVVECDSIEHAFDEVTMRTSGAASDYFDPFSKMYVGEHLLQGREITEEILVDMQNELHEAGIEDCGHVRKIDYKQ